MGVSVLKKCGAERLPGCTGARLLVKTAAVPRERSTDLGGSGSRRVRMFGSGCGDAGRLPVALWGRAIGAGAIGMWHGAFV